MLTLLLFAAACLSPAAGARQLAQARQLAGTRQLLQGGTVTCTQLYDVSASIQMCVPWVPEQTGQG
jgi:hypothetical protein